MADSTVSIGADLSQLRRELAKLPNLGADAAQKTLIQVEKAVQSAEKAAKKASKDMARANKAAAKQAVAASKTTESALKDVGDTAGDTESSIRAISGALGMISPEAESAMNVVAELSGGFEGLTKATGLLGGSTTSLAAAAGVAAVAVAAIGTVAIVVANRTADARAQMQEYRSTIWDTDAATRALVQSQNALKLATGDVAGFVADLQIQTALMNGEISSVDIEAGKLGGTLADTLRPQLLSAGTALASNELRVQALRESMESGRLSFKDYAEASLELDTALAATDGLQKNLDAVKRLKDEGRTAIDAYTAAKDQHTTSEKKNQKAVKRSASALKEEEDATAAAAQAVLDAAAVIVRVTSERIDAAMSDRDRLKISETQALAELLATEVATAEQIAAVRQEFSLRHMDLAATEMEAAEQDLERRLKLEEDLTAAKDAARAADLQSQQEYAAQGLDLASSGASALEGLAAQVADNATSEAERGSKAKQKAVLIAFKAEKAAALTTAAINTALAIQKAIAMFGPPPSPFGIAGIATALTIGATQIGAIAATAPPTFHTGGVIQQAKPGEVDIRALPGEAVLPRDVVAANGGPGEVMQRARSGFGGGAVSVDLKLRHRSLDRITAEVMGAGGRTSMQTRGLRSSGYSNPYSRS